MQIDAEIFQSLLTLKLYTYALLQEINKKITLGLIKRSNETKFTHYL